MCRIFIFILLKIEEAVRAFKKLLKLNSDDGKDLFGSEGKKISLQVAGIKVPREREQQVIKMRLPHSPHPPIRDICLFVKDLQPGIKADHEDTVRHFTDLLAEKGVKGVTQVRPWADCLVLLIILYADHPPKGTQSGVQAV